MSRRRRRRRPLSWWESNNREGKKIADSAGGAFSVMFELLWKCGALFVSLLEWLARPSHKR